MRELTCSEVADSAPGFALDILEPATRARVTAHLIRCTDCRQSVTDMEESAAELLDLDRSSAGEEPYWPADHDLPAVRPARRRLRMVITMAAAAALFVGTTVGPELAGHRPEQPIASGVLVSGQRALGTVKFYAGDTPLIEVQADHLPASGKLGVIITYSDGTARRVGEVDVRGGYALWAGKGPAHTTSVSSVVLVDATSHQVATAAFG